MATIKFSEFNAGNINVAGAQLVGLTGGNTATNARFTAADLVNGLATVTYVDAQDAGLQSQITQNTNDIANIDLSGLQSNVSTLQGQVSVLQGNIVVLDSAVAALENNVTVNSDDITVIRGNIVAIENELANIADTDAQTLSWDSGNANLSISNGNTVTLTGLDAQTLSLDNSSNVLTISGGNTVDFTTVLGNVAGGGGLPANVNITTEDITLTVTSNADLADLQNVIATYRLTSSLDTDGSREHAPIIYVDVSPGNYAVGGYFSIEHMTPNVRFRSNGGDRTDTIIVFNAQVNIIDSTVRFDGIDVRFPNWLNVTDNSWLGLGMSTAINFESDYFTIVRGAYAESKNVTFGYTYTELSQNGMFWSGSGSNWAGTASDWWLLDTSQVHLEGSGGTNLFDFNDVYVAMQSKFYARHVGGVTVTCGGITLDDQSQAYIRSSSGTIDCTDVDAFDTSDLHLEATTVNASGDVRLFHQSRLACTGAFNVTGSVELFDTSMLTADNLTVAGSNNLNIYEGSQVVVEDRCTAPFIDMEGGTLTAVGSTSSTDGDIYTQSLTADFGSHVAAKNDIAPSGGSTTVEVNLMDSKLVTNRILNAGQVNLISSDLRSEDGIQLDETNGFLQAFGSYIGLNGPISQVGFTAASNGIYLEGSTLMSDATITCSYFDLNASKMITSSTLTVNGVTGTSSEIDIFLGSEVHCLSLRKTNTFDTNNFLYARLDNGSTLHVAGQLGATTGDGLTLTANIELNHGSKCFIEDNSSSNNIGNCNIVVQNFSEFFSPLGRVSDYL